MNIFFYISQKVYKTKNIYYPSDEKFIYNTKVFDSNNKPFNEEYINIYTMIESIYLFCKNNTLAVAKYKMLAEVYNNIFSSEEYKAKYVIFFSKIQKVYHVFARLYYIFKYKKAILLVNSDLSLNTIKSTNRNIITIMQLNTKYMFTLNDLTNIIETALSNSPDFFIDVLNPKNPYNNVAFNISTLYNIYFKFKESSFVMSSLFHLFFIANFNKTSFVLDNEELIREFAIRKFLRNADINILYNKIIFMLKENVFTRKLIIHKDFSKKLLVDIMKPFLYYKYIADYGITGLVKTDLYKKILYYKLRKFYEYNRKFGKIIYTNIGLGNSIRQTFIFDTDHITFESISLDGINLNRDIPENNILPIIHVYFSDGNLSQSSDDDE